MSLFTRFGSNLIYTTQRFSTKILTNNFHNLANNFNSVTNNFNAVTNNFLGVANTSKSLVPGGIFPISVRNKIRCYFPKPSERKRIKRHGFWARMSTLAGRRVLMRRILKGRHVLSH